MYHVVIHGQEVRAEYHHAVTATSPRLHVDREGQGPAVVLAHGFAGSARNFGPQARALRPRFRVVRYDARGHARSEAPDDPSAYTPETFADDLGRMLDPGSAIVGGLSMGAATALRFALASPERVRALVLAAFPAGASAARGIASQATAFADAIERDGLDAASERFAWGPTSGLDTGAARLVRQGFLEHLAARPGSYAAGRTGTATLGRGTDARLGALRIPPCSSSETATAPRSSPPGLWPPRSRRHGWSWSRTPATS